MRNVARVTMALAMLCLVTTAGVWIAGCDTSNCDPNSNCVPEIQPSVDADVDAAPDVRAEGGAD